MSEFRDRDPFYDFRQRPEPWSLDGGDLQVTPIGDEESGRYEVDPSVPPEVGDKQFQIVVEDKGGGAGTLIYVREGEIMALFCREDQSSGQGANWVTAPWTVAELTGPGPGTSTTTYVWLQVTINDSLVPTDLRSASQTASADVGVITNDEVASVAIYTDTTNDPYTTAIDNVAASTTASKWFYYLGKVVTDGSGNPTITQNNFGPVQAPAITYLKDHLWNDGTNILDIKSTAYNSGLYLTLNDQTGIDTSASSAGTLAIENVGVVSLDLTGGGKGISFVGTGSGPYTGAVTIANTGVTGLVGAGSTTVSAGGTGHIAGDLQVSSP